MTSEREKMLAGELYDPLDSDLVARRVRARDLCQALNATRESETEQRRAILRDLFGAGGDTVVQIRPQPIGERVEPRTDNAAGGGVRAALGRVNLRQPVAVVAMLCPRYCGLNPNRITRPVPCLTSRIAPFPAIRSGCKTQPESSRRAGSSGHLPITRVTLESSTSNAGPP